MKADDPRHGTVNGYNNYGCRCDACRTASREYNLPKYEARHKVPCVICGEPARKYPGGKGRCRKCFDTQREAPHGTETRYKRCRCSECRMAAARARRVRRRRAAA